MLPCAALLIVHQRPPHATLLVDQVASHLIAVRLVMPAGPFMDSTPYGCIPDCFWYHYLWDTVRLSPFPPGPSRQSKRILCLGA